MNKLLTLTAVVAATLLLSGCPVQESKPTSSSGVTKTTAKVKVGADGMTVEQRNVKERLKRDNQIGSYKHLYIISAYSGDVLIYSTVKGKVTSSSKRLTPVTVSTSEYQGVDIAIGRGKYRTGEVIQDDGTYGSSVPYVFWFDSKGSYHQHYVSGGQIMHVSDTPLSVGKIIINMEATVVTENSSQ